VQVFTFSYSLPSVEILPHENGLLFTAFASRIQTASWNHLGREGVSCEILAWGCLLC
jgi:hypothetical protein